MSTNDPMTQEQLDAIRERLSARGVKNGERDMRAEQSFAREAPQDITNLLAEVERLRARLTVDDEMEHRVALALSAHWRDMTTNRSLDRQRHLAAVALETIFGTKGEA